MLILQKVQQDLQLEAQRKEEEKRSLIDSLVDPLDIEGASEDQILETLVNLYQRVWEAEKKRLNTEYQIVRKDFEVRQRRTDQLGRVKREKCAMRMLLSSFKNITAKKKTALQIYYIFYHTDDIVSFRIDTGRKRMNG